VARHWQELAETDEAEDATDGGPKRLMH
jgi:hypothetical protein